MTKPTPEHPRAHYQVCVDGQWLDALPTPALMEATTHPNMKGYINAYIMSPAGDYPDVWRLADPAYDEPRNVGPESYEHVTGIRRKPEPEWT